MVEQIGSGIARINDLMKLAGLPKPHFDTDGMFTLTVKRPVISSEKTREKTREKVLEILKQNKLITISALAISIGFSKKGIEYQLNKLKKTI